VLDEHIYKQNKTSLNFILINFETIHFSISALDKLLALVKLRILRSDSEALATSLCMPV